MFALRHFFCTLAPFDFDKADGYAGSFRVRVREEVGQRADRAPPVVGQYTGVHKAIDGVFGPVADVVGIDAAVLGNPVEDEIHGRRNGFELAAGDPGYLTRIDRAEKKEVARATVAELRESLGSEADLVNRISVGLSEKGAMSNLKVFTKDSDELKGQ